MQNSDAKQLVTPNVNEISQKIQSSNFAASLPWRKVARRKENGGMKFTMTEKRNIVQSSNIVTILFTRSVNGVAMELRPGVPLVLSQCRFPLSRPHTNTHKKIAKR